MDPMRLVRGVFRHGLLDKDHPVRGRKVTRVITRSDGMSFFSFRSCVAWRPNTMTVSRCFTSFTWIVYEVW